MLDKQKKKELAADYTQTFRLMGVYQIRNVKNNKVLVAGTMDLDGARNRFEFCQQTRLNTTHEIQRDWLTYGADSFVFEELDRIQPREDVMVDASELRNYRSEVDALLELWLEKLQPYDEAGYNRRKHNKT
ncbi:GIY-YIG nuclease family protein [Paenibacillus roseipurpureus]|uniref:GIY-YIG nuclease family protein n=1 Tax=Paenibacillus roseopurpureus TaxID=2918901 RepID=A0AA96RMS3_9BACL|nr:GIY-YIG nuclease family protein [Paenibacillus sp. MBLB1832]WNR46776.1 GIY-YIG nuclease family protein [Paenibacillus sp. MBLB1832]